jgi:tetratricopeptide (TPR) repeat protein
LASVSAPEQPEPLPEEEVQAEPRQEHLGWWGAGLVLSLLGLGSFIALEIGHILGERAGRAYFDETQTGEANPDYEKAEQEWSKGNFLEAIAELREYLAHNPREQHAALRIAEIYEKDLRNYLAAALEYEEVLKQKLPPERWGWAAIHLCNLYSKQLNKPEKAIDLLLRIDREYSSTGAAKKARKRLEQLAAEGVIDPLPPRPEETSSPKQESPAGGDLFPETEAEEDDYVEDPEYPETPLPPPDSGSKLPPGFRPLGQ